MTVTIRTRTVGQAFGTVAEIVDAQGRVVDQGTIVPYGWIRAAIDFAEARCAARGWTVRQ